MKAIAYIVSNIDDIVAHQKEKERLGDLPNSKEAPQMKEVELEIHFGLYAVSFCFLQPDNRIKCFIAGQIIMLKNEGGVYEAITKFLDTR